MDQLLWRVTLMVEIAARKQKVNSRLGKTAMQKLLYILQEGMEIPLGYRFDLYTYGPYSSAVMRDIDYGAWTGMLKVEYEGDRGYEITPGPDARALDEYRQALEHSAGRKLNEAFEHFGTLNASELELRATVLYVEKDEPSLSEEQLIERVQGLKPRFDVAEIRRASENLRTAGLLKGVRTA
jgi:uncharacterized protein YwgA